MATISREQFNHLCEYWDYTPKDAYKAICFVNTVACQYIRNLEEELNKEHSDAFREVLEKKLEKYFSFYSLYGQMDTEIFKMLERSEENG